VQGDGAAETIVEALYALYDQDVDVIIVARGGGSMEDLWAFNEEIVARAVFAGPVPVVSGVGHETDTTIIDYVADLRAPTPSAAAEQVAPELNELRYGLDDLRARMAQAVYTTLNDAREQLADRQRRIQTHSPTIRIARDRQMLDDWLRRASSQVAHQVTLRQARLSGLHAQLAALSPLATLERGYAVVRRAADGKVITTPQQAAPGDRLEVTVKGGAFEVRRENGD
jgi:exodeoxyribonuclease VII large subunit